MGVQRRRQIGSYSPVVEVGGRGRSNGCGRGVCGREVMGVVGGWV